jgi:hypothetical protein
MLKSKNVKPFFELIFTSKDVNFTADYLCYNAVEPIVALVHLVWIYLYQPQLEFLN